ncbi:cytochrome-c peroxidase [Sanyastnella coralliicola]|uniref:cytochrome-c peroxidase n=1 Tax=Sanyastnella coralliicola TaxID=3069118 RepID=UPI0027B9AE0B|nr:cytochrome c peroxidase [Longitalea sp. SCSIO 12813]
MQRSINRIFLASAVVLLTLAGCKKDKTDDQTTEVVDLDAQLREVLETASNGQGLNYFILPESDQFSLIPQDPLNPLNTAKVELGRLLFHETGIGLNPRLEIGTGTFSCATCHHSAAGFQANVRQGIGEGGIGFGMSGEGREANPAYPADSMDIQTRRSPTIMNSAYQDVMLWNGQFGATGVNEGTESQWTPGTPIFNNNFGHQGVETQAIAGLTVHRSLINEEICQEIDLYEELFDIAFPDWPEATRYTNRTGGLAIAAYERTILANQSPWQDWLRGNTNAMTDSEKRGATLFFSKAECNSCHSGPALSSMTFYGIGMNDLSGPDVINGTDDDKGRGGFTGNPEDEYKFKTPQLYNLRDSPFFGHGGTFTSVRQVIEYKNNAVAENMNVPASQLAEEFHALQLTEQEIDDLVNFIEYALYDPNLVRYTPDALPSGQCFPNNDAISQIDQGCIE